MDNVSAANASISRALHAASVNSATCNKCGCTSVAWVKSARSGKNYLAETIFGKSGKVIPIAHQPHFKNCGQETSHCHPSCGCKSN